MDTNKKKEPKRRGRPPGKANKKLKVDSEWQTIKKEEIDPCDCLTAKCPGCWYPCETCDSNKCSTFCRKIRRGEQLEWKNSD